MKDTLFLVLAAGSSSRLGRPKQLLPFRGTTLLGHTVSAAVSTGYTTLVVAGSGEEDVTLALAGIGCEVISNPGWEEGIASSIRTGISYILHRYEMPVEVMLMVCDQPFVEKSHLLSLLEKKQNSGKKIIASSYNGTLGTPVLFDAVLFPELLQLTGNEGAKKIIMKEPQRVASVAFPLGGIDIDTQEDLQRYLT